MVDRPLLLLTRPKDGSERFAELVKARIGDEFEILIAPLQEIEWVEFEPASEQPEALIFTSQNGVFGWNRVDSGSRVPAYCVGPQTTKAAAAAGHKAKDCGGDAEALIKTIMAENPDGPLLHVHGEHSRGRIAERLTNSGIPTDSRIAYRQVAMPLSASATTALKNAPVVIAPLFSPRSAFLLMEALPRKAEPWLAVISPNAAERVDAMLQRRMMVAEKPDADGMLDAVKALLAAARNS